MITTTKEGVHFGIAFIKIIILADECHELAMMKCNISHIILWLRNRGSIHRYSPLDVHPRVISV